MYGGGGWGPEGPGSPGSCAGSEGALPGACWGPAAHSPHWLMFMRNRGSWEPSALMQERCWLLSLASPCSCHSCIQRMSQLQLKKFCSNLLWARRQGKGPPEPKTVRDTPTCASGIRERKGVEQGLKRNEKILPSPGIHLDFALIYSFGKKKKKKKEIHST